MYKLFFIANWFFNNFVKFSRKSRMKIFIYK